MIDSNNARNLSSLQPVDYNLHDQQETQTKIDTYQLEPQNFSLEQIRYLERMKKASLKQNQVYKLNSMKKSFEPEKEKYAKLLEHEIIM